MQRRQLVHRAIAGGFASLMLGRATGSISADPRAATLDDAGTTVAVLGAVSPAAAPGYRLQLVRSARPIGWANGSRGESGAIVSCVTSGELTVELQTGAGMVWRAQEADAPPVEVVRLNVPVICQAGDCFTVDADTIPTLYTAWNAGREPVVLWEAYLSLIPLSRHWRCG